MDHDLSWRDSEEFTFSSQDARLSGTVWLPDIAPRSAIVLVHGDGPQDRLSGGGYAPLIHALLDRGIAVASWDKPGIGRSGGNWLDQSMADRAIETRAALAHLSQRFEGLLVGALGFSQAGWVLPRLTADDASFLVLIGPAVSWRDQGDYYTRTRLELEGFDATAIARALDENRLADERIFGEGAEPADASDMTSPDRWRFIRTNRDADARGALSQLDLPLLAMWGAEDLNVDATGDSAIYRAVASGRHPDSEIIVWPNAAHGLLKADAYNWQSVDQWSLPAKLRFFAEGRHAFAPGSLEKIAAWINARDHAVIGD